MAIRYKKENKVFTLDTKNTSYQMKVADYGVLQHLYYGKKIADDNMEYLCRQYDRGFSGNLYDAGLDRTFSTDTLPQEYPSFGNGDFRAGCVNVVNPDGSYAADFRFVSYEIKEGKYQVPGMPAVYDENNSSQTLVVKMEDKVTGLGLDLYYGVFEEADIITRAVRLKNGGAAPVRLEKALSVCLDLPQGKWDMMHFHGRHAMEREMERTPCMHGIRSIGSKRGSSSHHHNPFIILCEKNANEEYGSCYGMSLVYSGGFQADVEVDYLNQTRAVLGIQSEQFSWLLKEGEEFAAPEVVLTYSAEGFQKLSQNYHQIYRYNLCRGEYKLKRRPILINNWEATYFKFDSDKLVSIAEDAKELGIEMLVMDDGWFGKREADNSGLGDWFVNTQKLQGELSSLTDRVNALGLKFGIWFEPEMVSEDSDLYRTHPDWALQVPGRDPVRSRYQLVLDMSREDVREHIFRQMCEVLDHANIEYIKWDMNRSICDIYSAKLPADRQGETAHRYVLGLYELLEKLTSKYPHILFEGCSGGGGRFDPAMLYYSPQIWCSDNTDAIERIKIQYGTSFGYPISAVGSHVSACPNHQTGRSVSFQTRGTAAMAGSFGYELDLNQLNDEERRIVKAQVEDFKKYYDVIHNGIYYRLTNPYEDKKIAAWQFVSNDKTEALLNVIYLQAEANGCPPHILLKGLDPQKIYLVGEQLKVSGSALMYGGYTLENVSGDYQSCQLHIKEV